MASCSLTLAPLVPTLRVGTPVRDALRPEPQVRTQSVPACVTTRSVVTSICFCVCLLGAAALPAAEPPAFELQTLRGRVVYLHEALEKRFDITSVPEAKERTLALQTADGTLVPLVEDIRGRAFRVDERLRKMNVQMLVRRYQGSPAVQVIRLFEVTDDGLLELDYWCDICAIVMYEFKACECCQGQTELRRQKVETR